MSATNAPPVESTSRGRLDYIDVLRGVACLWILLHHSNAFGTIPAGWTNWPLHVLAKLADMGWLGVSLFLVLSGFCLYYPLVCRDEPAAIRLNLRQFALRRAWRILPPYYAAMTAYVAYHVASAIKNHESVAAAIGGKISIPLHLLLVHNLNTRTFSNINGAFWSIALEVQLYLLFPLFILLVQRGGLKLLLACTFVVAVAWQAAVYSQLGLGQEWNSRYGTWYYALPGRAFEFAIGMAVAAMGARCQEKFMRLASRGVLFLLIPAVWYGGFITRFGPGLDQIWGILFGSLLILCHQIPNIRFQQWPLRLLVWLGTISYSVYLIHGLVFLLLPLEEMRGWAPVPLIVGRMLLAIAIGFAFFWAFERPFLARKKRAAAAELAQAAALSPAP